MRSRGAHTIAVLLALAFGSDSLAGTGGREIGRVATHIYNREYTLLANTSYIVETTNLSGGADTVLHVQLRPSGTFLDGNDDCWSRLSGCFGYRSYVSIPAVSYSRDVWIVVRAYGSSSGGSASLRISPAGGMIDETPMTFTAGYTKTFSSYGSGSHFFTVEEQGGSGDTVLLVTSQGANRAIAYDDDDGVGLMSWVHVDEACSDACTLIVGTAESYLPTATTVMWDEDIHTVNCATENPADGLSDTLEAALGTAPCNADTDQDGLLDNAEVICRRPQRLAAFRVV